MYIHIKITSRTSNYKASQMISEEERFHARKVGEE